MNPRDAISAEDLYVDLTEPTYYCDRCGGMGSPLASGLYWDCETIAEDAPGRRALVNVGRRDGVTES
jgi:hypothetical protein